jgi:hypothetical protein
MKQIIICLLILLTGTALSAQKGQWAAGLYGMAGRTHFSYSDVAADRFNKGTYQLGVFGQYAMTDRLRWRLGLGFAYANAGYRTVEGGVDIPGFPSVEGDPYEIRFKFTHMTLPIEMLFDLNRKPGGFYLLLGPALRVRLQGEAEKTAVLQGNGGPFTKDFTSEITNQQVELFGTFGLGYAFLLHDHFSLFVQPVFTTNVGGEVIATIKGRKEQAGFVTAYEFGVQIGVARRF